jgi:hypothetical protein
MYHQGAFVNHFCRGKAYLCVCVCVCVRVSALVRGRVQVRAHVALLIQHATRMRHTVTSFVAPLESTLFF